MNARKYLRDILPSILQDRLGACAVLVEEVRNVVHLPVKDHPAVVARSVFRDLRGLYYRQEVGWLSRDPREIRQVRVRVARRPQRVAGLNGRSQPAVKVNGQTAYSHKRQYPRQQRR